MEVMALERKLTELDHLRLTNFIQRYKSETPGTMRILPIEHVLGEAEVVSRHQLPPDVVTMHSRVLLKDSLTGAESELTLCYPAGADASAGWVSVLSPVGWSLLGQRVGATVVWPTPDGVGISAEILDIPFRPESSGDSAK